MRHNHERRINSTILQPAIPMNKLLKVPEWQCREGFKKDADSVCHCYGVYFEPVSSHYDSAITKSTARPTTVAQWHNADISRDVTKLGRL